MISHFFSSNHRRSPIPFALTEALRGCRAYENHRGSTASEYNRLLSTHGAERHRMDLGGTVWTTNGDEESMHCRPEHSLKSWSWPVWHGRIIHRCDSRDEWTRMETNGEKIRPSGSRSHVEWNSRGTAFVRGFIRGWELTGGACQVKTS